jgi:A/G-specific adenine glycosylase
VYETEFTTAEQIINGWLSTNQLRAKSVSSDLLKDSPKPIKHSLTHFHWYLTPQSLSLNAKQSQQLTTELQAAEINVSWLNGDEAQATLGLPRAMVKILEGDL